jgi:hypothetical protein
LSSVIAIREQIYKTPPMTDAVFVAHAWIVKGWRVVPCLPNSKQLIKGYGPHQNNLEDPKEIEYWFRNKRVNIAVLAPTDAIILDFDNRNLYTQFCEASPEAAVSYTEFTPRGGAHIFLKFQEQINFEPVKDLELKRIGLVYPSKVGGLPYRVGGGVIQQVNLEEVLYGFGSVKEIGLINSSLPRPSHGQIEPIVGAVAKVKSDWPLREYLTFFEPKLKLSGSGRWLSGLCPFHDDSHPSLWVDIYNDLWGCHACAAHGDVINWHSLRKNITVRGAIKDLIKWSETVKRGLEG